MTEPHDPLMAAAERHYAAAHGESVGSTKTALEILRLLTDDELVGIWRRCGDDPTAAPIAEEMARREIDF